MVSWSEERPFAKRCPSGDFSPPCKVRCRGVSDHDAWCRSRACSENPPCDAIASSSPTARWHRHTSRCFTQWSSRIWRLFHSLGKSITRFPRDSALRLVMTRVLPLPLTTSCSCGPFSSQIVPPPRRLLATTTSCWTFALTRQGSCIFTCGRFISHRWVEIRIDERPHSGTRFLKITFYL